MGGHAPEPGQCSSIKQCGRICFSSIPDAFGFNSKYWHFQEGGTGAEAIRSMHRWETWWGKINPLEEMRNAGFGMHRSSIYWARNEAVKGTYNWNLFDPLMEENERLGLRPMLIMAYGHQGYDTSSGPSVPHEVHAVLTEEGRAGFAAWAGEVARRYSGRQAIYELWNEPNLSLFWPEPDPAAYVALDAKEYTEEQRLKMGEPGQFVGQESGVRTPLQWSAQGLAITVNNWPRYLLINDVTP